MLADYMTEMPAEFARMLENYDRAVSGSLDFDYCDVVADLLAHVYASLDDLALRSSSVGKRSRRS